MPMRVMHELGSGAGTATAGGVADADVVGAGRVVRVADGCGRPAAGLGAGCGVVAWDWSRSTMICPADVPAAGLTSWRIAAGTVTVTSGCGLACAGVSLAAG